MIDVYKYIESEDVVKYLKEIKYQFSATQIVYLIINSLKQIPLKTINNDLNTIMKEYEDEKITTIGSYRFGKEKTSLFELIKEKTETEERLLKEFYKNDGIFEYNGDRLFNTFENLISYVQKNNESLDNETICISKKYINSDRLIEVTTNGKLEPLTIIGANMDCALINDLNINFVFIDGCYEAIPLPFNNGEIVCTTKNREKPLIIVDDEYEKVKTNQKHFKVYGKYDPNRIKCMYYEDGSIYYDHLLPMEMVNYTGTSNEELALLKTIHDHILGKTELIIFLHTYTKALNMLSYKTQQSL